ncbi:MAG: hypothetical protein Q7R45_07170 [Sulfuricaulis sp.]|nr:hypothetical protein [Sulfuricaulis sp.]
MVQVQRNAISEPIPVQEHFATEVHVDCQEDHIRVTFLTSRPIFAAGEEAGREHRAEVAIVIPASAAPKIGQILIEADKDTHFLRLVDCVGHG